MKIGPITILINDCTEGIYLRWFYNGWHYFNFQNGYEVAMTSESMGTQVTNMFSVISKIERPTRLKAEYSYSVTLDGITPENITGFTGLLMAERVEQYENATWYVVNVTRGDHLIKNPDTDSYIFNFEITRKDLSNQATVIQDSTLLYIGDTLADLDDDEVIPINKQVNDIAEMQDRQSDFTAQFKIRKTRAMRELFELSGEVGANTTFPYEKQECRLVQDSVEVITKGVMILDDSDNDYYYVSIYSGNLDFFSLIEGQSITDLIIASMNHTWDVVTMAGTHAADLDYVYPLCEPSDDGGLSQLITTDDLVSFWGGHIWCFVKVKAIWDAIFAAACYTVTGDILTNEKFLAMHMPISSRTVTKDQANKYLYSMFWEGAQTAVLNWRLAVVYFPGIILINGDPNFLNGYYVMPYDATYKLTVYTRTAVDPTLSVYLDLVHDGDMTLVDAGTTNTWEYEITGDAGEEISIQTTAVLYYYFSIVITEIIDPEISYSSEVIPMNHVTDLSQKEFIKMICNQFGLVPVVSARDKKINFWNYDELYSNMSTARDWSAYLSETDDSIKFKFGDYAQRNNMRYKDSLDVSLDNGAGVMQVDDETLQDSKDVIQLPLATCDEVTILDDVIVSRLDFNHWDDKTGLYEQNDNIDPRMVYISKVGYSAASPFYEKTMRLRSVYAGPATVLDITTPKKASSHDISFSKLVANYASLKRMLTKVNLRTVKLNLPVYEVAGLRYEVPVYIKQYKAYFYVNKINNYVWGRLCGIDLIKL